MATNRPWLLCAALCCFGCGDEDGGAGSATLSGGDAALDGAANGSDAGANDPVRELLALTYNVAGLPEALSGSMPERNTPIIGPLLNGYDLVLLQESWQTPDPNPGAPQRVYHELLVEASDHPYKSEPAETPWGMDEERPLALLGDGLNVFSRYPIGDTERVRWPVCVDDQGNDCLALKGFSVNRLELGAGVEVDLYNLHMDAGGTSEDDDARAQGIDLLLEHLAEHSEGRAVIVGGDFNLHTDREPAASQFARLLEQSGLHDACTELDCDRPGSIDKFLFRSSAEVAISAEALTFETDVFVADDGAPLSDHEPVAVRFAWSGTAD